MMASLLYRTPKLSETIGAMRGRWDKGQYVQAWVWDSRSLALASVLLGLRAASFTSSRRVGIRRGY